MATRALRVDRRFSKSMLSPEGCWRCATTRDDARQSGPGHGWAAAGGYGGACAHPGVDEESERRCRRRVGGLHREQLRGESWGSRGWRRDEARRHARADGCRESAERCVYGRRCRWRGESRREAAGQGGCRRGDGGGRRDNVRCVGLHDDAPLVGAGGLRRGNVRSAVGLQDDGRLSEEILEGVLEPVWIERHGQPGSGGPVGPKGVGCGWVSSEIPAAVVTFPVRSMTAPLASTVPSGLSVRVPVPFVISTSPLFLTQTLAATTPGALRE